MNAERCIVSNMLFYSSDDFGNFMRQRATVRVTHHEMSSALHDRCFNDAHRKFRIVLVTVKEVFKIDKNTPTIAVEEINRIRHHENALFERGLQSVGDVIVPRLRNDAHSGGVGVEQIAQRGIVIDFSARTTRRTKSNKS